MRKLKITQAMSRLEKRVARIINSHVEQGYSLLSVMRDLLQSGCASGVIGQLVYTKDCVRFYKLYRKEIDALVQEFINDCDLKLASLPGWDKTDPFA